jgi:hypothetical protein
MKKLLLLCLVILGFIGVPAQERYVKPVDEAKKDASFLAFRAKLIAAAKKRDTKYILSILDKEIRNSRNGSDGVEEFKSWWKIESADSKFWDDFLAVITNGGKFAKTAGGAPTALFTAPFIYEDFPGDLDAFSHEVIFGSNVSLRAKPEMKAPTVGKLSYNIVRITETVKDKNDPEKDAWYKVETLGGKTGFVKAAFVRSPVDYRAGFEKQNGKWKMIYFVAGE